MNGASPAALAAAVCNAGGLGSCAASLLSPDAIVRMVREMQSLTDKPFNVNLFVLGEPQPDHAEIFRSLQRLAPFYRALAIPPPRTPPVFCENFETQLEALLYAAPPVVSFTFGILTAEQVGRFRRAGCLVIGTATTVAEGIAWENVGADFICAQGAEAGGHRATFLGDVEQSCIGLIALVLQMAAAVAIPVIAAGGIMDGRGIASVMLLGAQAAQLGTAFLSCPECPISSAWKEQLLSASDDSTRLTRTFSGRYARAIVNEFMQTMRAHETTVQDYPIQNALTTPMRREATHAGRPEFMSMWAGQGAGMSRRLAAVELMATLVRELDAAGGRLLCR